MHLVLPFAAGSSQSGTMALQALQLPRLQKLLVQFDEADAIVCEATDLNLPHEHWLARHRGWSGGDGRLPFASHLARGDGLAPQVGDAAWGLLTPSHWQAGREQIVLTDPAQLQLTEAESRALFEAVRTLFETDGWALHWGAPLRWYAQHASLGPLATASLDRVIGRAIDAWLPERRAGAAVRRLQSEVQMLLHEHPIHAQREARGVPVVNSFWLSGTGVTPSVPTAAEPQVDERLRAPLLAEDWTAWAEAWQRLDAEVLPRLEAAAAQGQATSLTLCGERRALHLAPRRRSLAQRLKAALRPPSVQAVLESL